MKIPIIRSKSPCSTCFPCSYQTRLPNALPSSLPKTLPSLKHACTRRTSWHWEPSKRAQSPPTQKYIVSRYSLPSFLLSLCHSLNYTTPNLAMSQRWGLTPRRTDRLTVWPTVSRSLTLETCQDNLLLTNI
jgi:hypothetical protein